MIATQCNPSNGPVTTVKTCEDIPDWISTSQIESLRIDESNSLYNKDSPSDEKLEKQSRYAVPNKYELDDKSIQERYCKVISDLLGLLSYAVGRIPPRKKAKTVNYINGWLKDLLAEGIEPNPGPVAFKYYGNYGGPGYTAGKFGGSDFSVKPIDDLDDCFRTHDFFYFNGLEKTGDKVLISQLNKLIPKLTGIVRDKAVVALLGFATKSIFTKNSNKITALTNADDLFKKYNIIKKAVTNNLVKHKVTDKIPTTAKDFYAALTGRGDYKAPSKRLVGVELNPGPPKVNKVKTNFKKQGIKGKSLSLIKAAVNPRQSGFAPMRKAKGKGDYISDIGHKLGSTLGGFLGGHAASLLGSVFGLGSYHTGKSVGSNSLLNGTSPPVIAQSDKQRAFIFRHREYINDITSSVAFTNNNYIINAGLFKTFPWLAPIAAAFEQYKVMGMLFEYKSMTSEISPNSSGSVIMGTEYNLTKPNFVSKIQMENSEYAVSCKPTESMLHAVECEPKEVPVNILDIRPGAVPSGQDPRFYDLANFQIATQGQTASSTVLGELWVTYEIAFFKPLFNSGLGLGLLVDKFSTGNVTAATFFGNAVARPGSILGCTVANSTITFPASISTGEYLINYSLTQTSNGTYGSAMTAVPTNCSILNIYSSATAVDAVSIPQTQTSIATNTWFFNVIVAVNAPGSTQATLVFTQPNTPGATNIGDLIIAQINGSIVS
jgi:hypothetical protein